jgi:hypothetical protein
MLRRTNGTAAALTADQSTASFSSSTAPGRTDRRGFGRPSFPLSRRVSGKLSGSSVRVCMLRADPT